VTGELFWDVICLQEVSKIQEKIFAKEPNYACNYLDYKKWKIALIYNKNKFSEVGSASWQYFDLEEGKSMKEGFISKKLQHKKTDITFFIYTTSLRAKREDHELRVK